MATQHAYEELIKLRDISSVFSRKVFVDMLKFNDYSHLDWLSSKYDILKTATYSELIEKAYSVLARQYRCEYVYKNELIKLLLKKYGTSNTVCFSEFRVGNSIADMVVFNGESTAFEIKTEFDTPRRLDKQMDVYKRFFDKCYIVVPESRLNDYLNIADPKSGVISMNLRKGRVVLYEKKQPSRNTFLDSKVLMSCLRTQEYTNIVSSLGVSLEGVAGYELYTFCYDVIAQAEENELRKLFLCEVKKRKNNTNLLRKYPAQLRQMMLSLNLPKNKADKLLRQLSINLNIT